MLNIALTVFSISLLAIHVVFFFSGKSFALATPNSRKKHLLLTPQIGGLVFGPLFISICWFFNLAPYWYLTGGLISIILGLIDDLFQISWIIKLITLNCNCIKYYCFQLLNLVVRHFRDHHN